MDKKITWFAVDIDGGEWKFTTELIYNKDGIWKGYCYIQSIKARLQPGTIEKTLNRKLTIEDGFVEQK